MVLNNIVYHVTNDSWLYIAILSWTPDLPTSFMLYLFIYIKP